LYTCVHFNKNFPSRIFLNKTPSNATDFPKKKKKKTLKFLLHIENKINILDHWLSESLVLESSFGNKDDKGSPGSKGPDG
jgi:hypothetical protein